MFDLYVIRKKNALTTTNHRYLQNEILLRYARYVFLCSESIYQEIGSIIVEWVRRNFSLSNPPSIFFNQIVAGIEIICKNHLLSRTINYYEFSWVDKSIIETKI